ncbi:aminotransferase [Paenibacillus sp. YN15]|uniref:aminotransferase n=1 Tax=Paenibacillus sp. YN15 TaxID=1742774 RepID=UPI00215BEDBF|nr:aminotransferase [Paenibacillus sp. YN15]
MKPNEMAYIRQQEAYGPETRMYGEIPGGSPYPGLENPYLGGTSGMPVPYYPQTQLINGGGAGAGAGAGGSGGGGLLGSLNMNQIKGFVDKMGGIDGIVGTMTRVQKMVSSFQQMAPMLKLLMGSFGAKAAANSVSKGKGYSRKRKKSRKSSKKRPSVRKGTGTRYKSRRR